MQVIRKPFVLRSAINLLAWAGILLASATAAWFAYGWSEREGYAHLDNVAAHQLDMYVASLDSELGKHEYLPGLLELDPDVVALLHEAATPGLAARVNRRLAIMNVRAGALAIFVLDDHGVARASSNWYQPGSYVGRDFSSLPYFADALREGQAHFFSPNAVLDSPEYYFVQPVRYRGRTLGLAVVKISLAPLESTWAASLFHSQSEKFLILDGRDDIIISSVPDWRYKHTTLGNAMQHARTAEGDPIQPFDMTLVRRLEHGNLLVRLPAAGRFSRGRLYVSNERFMSRTGWRLLTLTDAGEVRQNAWHTAVGAAALAAFIGLLGLYLGLRRRAIAGKLAARAALQQAHDSLERMVAERTAELHRANRELVHEVAERKHAEEVLREAQDELVQTSKLALLGQMSAGITHEINQPLTALRSLAHNSRLLLDRGRTDRLGRNLEAIAGITERIGRITEQLKSFARKSPLTMGPVRLERAVENVLLLLENRIRSERIQLAVEIPPGLFVLCDDIRLEQVLINLFANAFDAMKDSPLRQLKVRAGDDGECARISVEDSGPGIPESALPRLFEPFFTTKPQGEGLGLGLAISAGIVREFGGTLRVQNTGGGAAFEFDLMLAKESIHV